MSQCVLYLHRLSDRDQYSGSEMEKTGVGKTRNLKCAIQHDQDILLVHNLNLMKDVSKAFGCGCVTAGRPVASNCLITY